MDEPFFCLVGQRAVHFSARGVRLSTPKTTGFLGEEIGLHSWMSPSMNCSSCPMEIVLYAEGVIQCIGEMTPQIV